MNTTKFKSTVTKGNNRGAGFIRIPLQIRSNFSVGDQYKVMINSEIEYYSKIRDYRGNGIFVPIEINTKNNLYGKCVKVELDKIDGFYAKVGSEGRVYIPNFYDINGGDIISVSVKINENEFVRYPRIYLRERGNTKEITFCLDSEWYNKEAIIKLNEIFQKNKLVNSSPIFDELLRDLDFAEIEKRKIIVYYGNRIPIIINNSINLNNLAHYLGCYFSDGTKRGNDWGICASTFEQANYFISKHNEIVSDPDITYSLTYTNYNEKDIEKLKRNLINRWSEKISNKIEDRRVRIIKTETEYAPNRNVYGALSMKEHKQLTQIYYNRLLDCLFKIIIRESDRDVATDFICGTMEGDGCLNSKTHGHIIITTNNEELKILKRICDKSYLKSSIRKWKGKPNRVDLVIGSLEIIQNISILKDKLFRYYPKRRRILKERLAKTGCSRFLLGKSEKTSNWLIGQLNERGILDGKGNLTELGKKIQKDLKEFLLSKD